jgi:hypothetical protein
MLMDPNDHMKIYSFADEVFRTDDFASNWNMLGKPTHFSNFIRDAAIAENNSQKMALASYNDIALTLDGGSSFTDITNTSTNQYVSDLAFDPNNDNTLIAVYSHHWDYKRVFISTNSGNTWQDITYNLNKTPIHCVIIDKQGNIYLGGELGVYTKTMNASTWSLYNQNLPNVAVKELEIQEATNTLRAATWGRGLWEAPLINREDHPRITNIETSIKPDNAGPMEAVPVHVQSVVSYSGIISQCYVKWSVDQPTLDSTITMTNIQDSTWRTNWALPDSSAGTKVYFKVFATASNGDITSSSKLMYTLHPNPALSVKEELQNEVKIYPNPTQGKVSIETLRPIEHYEIYDISGRVVSNKKIQNLNRFDIDISELPTGNYTIRLFSGDWMVSRLISKQ